MSKLAQVSPPVGAEPVPILNRKDRSAPSQVQGFLKREMGGVAKGFGQDDDGDRHMGEKKKNTAVSERSGPGRRAGRGPKEDTDNMRTAARTKARHGHVQKNFYPHLLSLTAEVKQGPG